MQKVKKIGILSLANIVSLICSSLAFLSVEVFYGLSVISAASRGNFKASLILILVNFGLGFLISFFTALIAGAVGWIIGVLVAGLYNFFAHEIGGVKIDFTDTNGETVDVSKNDKEVTNKKLFKY
jgi:hypothetical protein